MPGQHDLNKHQISVKFSHHNWRRIELAAQAHKTTPSGFIRSVVLSAIEDVELSAEDAQLIADRIRAAEEKGAMV